MEVTAGVVWSVAVAIYLIDCVVLLERGQAVLEWSGRGWRAQFGASRYTLADRPVHILHPLRPWSVPVRTLGLFAQSKSGAPTPAAFVRALAFTGALSAAQAVLVLALLPWLMHRAPGWPFVIALLISYANACVLLVLAWRSRAALGLASGSLAMHAVYCLVCLPLSVNAIRKTALLATADRDAWEAMRLVRGLAREEAVYAFSGQLEEARLSVEDATEAAARLDGLRNVIDQRRARDVGV